MTSFYLNNSLIESPLFILIIASAKTSATETISSLLNILLFGISIVSLTMILSIGASFNLSMAGPDGQEFTLDQWEIRQMNNGTHHLCYQTS